MTNKRRVLIIKTTSLGDVIHTLPAITEAVRHCPDLSFDWVVEDSFADIPKWHQNVENLFPVSVRKWRKSLYKPSTWKEIKQAVSAYRKQRYDFVIDAQGLFKSALLSKLAKGPRYGLDKSSAREGWVSSFYQYKINVPKGSHAITRLQQLFGHVFNYQPDVEQIDSGIKYQWKTENLQKKHIFFLHGTTWKTKHWPELYWINLAKRLIEQGYHVSLSWGNETEKKRANRLAEKVKGVDVLDRLSFDDLAKTLSSMSLVVSVDTGLSHLAAACHIPVIGLYGATSAIMTGSKGPNQMHITSDMACAPCLKRTCKISDNEYPPCLKGHSVEKVLEKVEQITRLSEH